jgi:hypothetical protein
MPAVFFMENFLFSAPIRVTEHTARFSPRPISQQHAAGPAATAKQQRMLTQRPWPAHYLQLHVGTIAIQGIITTANPLGL